MALWTDTNPKPGDHTPVLLSKIAQAVTTSAGITLGYTFVPGSGLQLDEQRIFRDDNTGMLSLLGGTAKSDGAWIDISGEGHATTPGQIEAVVKGSASFVVSTSPLGDVSPTELLTIDSSGARFKIAVSGDVTTLTDAATIATDASLGNHFRVTLGDNRTLGNPTNPADGQKVTWEIIQDVTGSRTLALDTKFAFGTDIPGITLTTTASKRDFLTAVYNSTADKWYVISFVKGY